MNWEIPRHGYSIHCARTGTCQGSRELAKLCHKPRRSPGKRDSSSSYLINMSAFTLEFTGYYGTAWVSFQRQRGFQPNPYISTSLKWQGASSGHFLYITEGILDACYDFNRETVDCRRARLSMLETTTGNIVHQVLLGGKVGDVSWSEQDDVCLQHHGMVMAGAAMPTGLQAPVGALPSSQKSAWRHYPLPDAHQPLGTPDPRNSLPHVLSPCGKIVVGLQTMKTPEPYVSWNHWHCPGDFVSKQPIRKAGACTSILLNNPDLRSLAWHPCKRACVFAVFDLEGGLHIIDANANCRVRY